MRKGRKIIERILGRILKEKEDARKNKKERKKEEVRKKKEDARKNKTEREKEEVDEEGGR